ncbi:hypothetical protein EUX98_g1930 [Antrodiella citrinella]|uniref:Nucleoporin Nup54 alpha-helical domain-containing protein n=1 Tax=Antrodiella citrinella TaxID=2447956 RepID=A0A4V3XJ91_9APHY|nr:hypothetical protein EUX98_g1930 [Antrodiella citrinella]
MTIRSTSIFGAKPAAATTGSIFGAQNANTAPKPAGSIFGNAVPNISTFGTQTQTQPAQGSLFGGQQQQQQQPQGSQQPIQPPSLFGQTPQNTQQQGGGLFGNAQQRPQQQGGGLFGNTQQQNTGTSSLFPQTQQAQNQTNTNQTSMFGGFGGASATTNPQSFVNPFMAQQSTTGGFGSGTASSNPLFGASAGNPLFGGASTNTANTGNTLFGGASTGFGAGSTSINPLMGNQSTNSLFGNRQQSQPAMSFSTSSAPGAPPFTKSTRFNDLPDMVKRVLEDIDTYIQGRIQICNNLKQMKLGDEASKGKELIRDVHKDLLHAIAVIQSDLLQTRTFKSKADQTVQDTIIATRIIDGFRYPQHGGVHLKNHAEFPLEYDNQVVLFANADVL